jgi:hypothetical protein
MFTLKSAMTGGKQMVKGVTDVAKAFPDRVMMALHQEAQIEVVEMKRRCPVDVSENAPHPGNLRASIHAEKPIAKGRTLTQTFATGIQAPYAVYVHEDPDAFHKVGEWKFIEGPLLESVPWFASRIAKRINFDQSKTVSDYLMATVQGSEDADEDL